MIISGLLGCIEAITEKEGLEFVGFRDVPVNSDVLDRLRRRVNLALDISSSEGGNWI